MSPCIPFAEPSTLCPCPPSENSVERLVFDFELTADLSDVVPNFLGPFSQGPKDARFVYINSGTAAGQMDSRWSRRAKISLMRITRVEIESVLQKPVSWIEARLPGIGRDGGPVCASVKGVKWRTAGL